MADQPNDAAAPERPRMDLIDDEQYLVDLFTYHPPAGNQGTRYDALRIAARIVARAVARSQPPSADRTAAIRKLREVVMTANAGIALGPAEYTSHLAVSPRSALITAFAQMPEEAFAWLALACCRGAMTHGAMTEVWPDGVGGFQRDSQVAIDMARSAAQQYCDSKSADLSKEMKG